MSTRGQDHHYGWTDAGEPDSCAYLTPRVMELLKHLGARRVCDVGSGNGVLAAALHQAGYYVVGVEPDVAGVTISRVHYPEISFYRLGVEDDASSVLLAEGSPFDVVVSTEVVEHLFSPHLLPTFARRLLPVGGHLIVSTPYHGYLKNVALAALNKWDDHHTALWEGGHIKFWSRDTLTQLLEDNGFRVVAFLGCGRTRWLWKNMLLVGRAV